MDLDPEIPFFGGEGVSLSTTPEQLASWVQPDHKIPLLLALSLYQTPHENFYGWNLVKDSYKIRYAAWFNQSNGQCVIGIRGTSVNKVGGIDDLHDDTVS